MSFSNIFKLGIAKKKWHVGTFIFHPDVDYFRQVCPFSLTRLAQKVVVIFTVFL